MAVSKKWLWALTAVPVAAVAVLLLGRNRGEVDAGDEVVADRVVFVVDSLLNENRRLTDSLAVVNARLDECESARADAKKKVDCPCKDKKPVAKKPVAKKPDQSFSSDDIDKSDKKEKGRVNRPFSG